MGITHTHYRMASREDIDLLVSMRLEFLGIEDSSPELPAIQENCCAYFTDALQEDTCDILLAEVDGICVGTGIVFYYRSVPSRLNPLGRNAYLTSMYVKPEHRRKGIGSSILHRIVEIASLRGHQILMLNASEMGKPLYRKIGFEEIHHGMLLKLTDS